MKEEREEAGDRKRLRDGIEEIEEENCSRDRRNYTISTELEGEW